MTAAEVIAKALHACGIDDPEKVEVPAVIEDLDAAGYRIVPSSTRWWSPAYRADNGNVTICGAKTVVRKYAEEDVARIKADTFNTRDYRDSVFLAFKDEIAWEQAAEATA